MTAVLFLCLFSLVVPLLSASDIEWYANAGDPNVTLTFNLQLHGNETLRYLSWYKEEESGNASHIASAVPQWQYFRVGSLGEGKFRCVKDETPWKLMILNVSVQDAGTYLCRFSKDTPEGDRNVNISGKLVVRDFMWNSSSSWNESEGNSVILDFSFAVNTNETAEKISWHNKREEIACYTPSSGFSVKAENFRGRLFETSIPGQLKLNSSQRGDEGDYNCTVSLANGHNSSTQFSTTGHLSVVSVPGKVTAKAKVEGTLRKGDNVSLQCHVENFPSVNLTWLHNNTELGSVEKDGVFTLPLQSCGANVTYECLAFSAATGENKSGSVQLNVECPPTIEVDNDTYPVATGGNVTVLFRLHGYPPPTFEVSRAAESSKVPSCIVGHTVTGMEASVTFVNVTEDCARHYRFKVSNKHGDANTTVNLQVASPPTMQATMQATTQVWVAVGTGLMVLAALLIMLCLAVLGTEMRKRARRNLGDEGSSSVENIPLNVYTPTVPRGGASVTSPAPHHIPYSHSSGDSTISGYERPQPFRVPSIYPNLPPSDGSSSSGYERPLQQSASPRTLPGGASAFPVREQSRLCRSASEMVRLQTLPDAIARPLPPLPLPPKTRRPSLASSYMGLGGGHPRPCFGAYGAAAAAAASVSSSFTYEDMHAAGRGARLPEQPRFDYEINAITDIPVMIYESFPGAVPRTPSLEEGYDADAEHSSSSASLTNRDSDGTGSLVSEVLEDTDERPEPPRENDPLLGAASTAALDNFGNLEASMMKMDRVMYTSTKALASLASRTASLERAKKQAGCQVSDECDDDAKDLEEAEPYYANTARSRKPVWQLTPKLPPRCPLKSASPITEEPPSSFNEALYTGTGVDGPQDAPESAPAPVGGPDPTAAPPAVNGPNTTAGPAPAAASENASAPSEIPTAASPPTARPHPTIGSTSTTASESATAPTTPASAIGLGDPPSAAFPPTNDPASGPTDASVPTVPSTPGAAAPGHVTEDQVMNADEQRPSHQLQPKQEAETDEERKDEEDQSKEKQPLPPISCRPASAESMPTTGFDLTPKAAHPAPESTLGCAPTTSREPTPAPTANVNVTTSFTSATPSATTPSATTPTTIPTDPFITVPLVRAEQLGSSPHTRAGRHGGWWKRSASEDNTSQRQPPVPPKTRRPRVLEMEKVLEVSAPPPCPLTPSVVVVQGPGDSSDDTDSSI